MGKRTAVSSKEKGINRELPLLKRDKPFRFHIVGMSHLPISERYMGCAFTQKVVKLSKMLLSLGHEVYLYGAEGSDTPCTEFVQTHTLSDIREAWGDGDNRFEIGYDWKSTMFRHDINGPKTKTTEKFIANAIEEINKRKRPDDFLVIMQGFFNKPIADGVNLFLTVEPGIGYRGSVREVGTGYSVYRGFESTYIQNFIYGADSGKADINGNYYDRVIPNYFDPKDFEYSEEKEDYFFFIGRLIYRKGVETAVKAVREYNRKTGKNCKLIIAGQKDDVEKPNYSDDFCEYVGYLEPEERTKYMAHARAVFVPTIYLEPFGGVNVEAQLCGTPVITTDFGAFTDTVVHGVTGYRCHTLNDFVNACFKVEKLKPKKIRQWAEQYLMENVKWKLEKWFRDLYQLYLSAADQNVKGWHHVE